MEKSNVNVSEEAQTTDVKFDNLMKEMEEMKANEQGYSKNSQVLIPGTLFTDFTNIVGQSKASLEAIKKSLIFGVQVIERMEDNLSLLTIQLMEQHVTNIKAGSTTSQELLDEEDAVEKIQEVK